ncbi:MAG TPA: O-antigen ligase family protein, partial [Candidatus Avacidaminococcus intestinavium]|nr:O-antigen ligase family protein [Candidatus Avacidaminococcus intestinavium]
SYQDKARVYIWERTLKIIGDEPVLGVGVGNFEKVFTSDKYKPTAGRENTSSQPHPHNMFLYSLVETGIVGTCGLLAVYIYQICFCYKRRYKLTQNIYTNMFLFTMMAIFIHGMVDTFYTRKMFFQLYLVIWGYACLSVLENTKAELKSTK